MAEMVEYMITILAGRNETKRGEEKRGEKRYVVAYSRGSQKEYV